MLYTKDIQTKFEDEEIILKDFHAIAPDVLKMLESFKGQKIVLKTGGFSDKFKKAFDQFENFDNSRRVYFKKEYSSFYLVFKYSFKDEKNSWRYTELDFYISYLKDAHTLENINENFITQHDKKITLFEILKRVQQIAQQIAACEELQELMPHYARQQLPYIKNIFTK